MARNLENLGDTYRAQNQYPQAEALYQRAVSIFRKSIGSDHVDTAEAMSRLGQLYELQGLYSQAEPLFQQALRSGKNSRVPIIPQVAGELKKSGVALPVGARTSWINRRTCTNRRWSSFTSRPSV